MPQRSGHRVTHPDLKECFKCETATMATNIQIYTMEAEFAELEKQVAELRKEVSRVSGKTIM